MRRGSTSTTCAPAGRRSGRTRAVSSRKGSHDSMPSNCAPSARFSHTDCAPGPPRHQRRRGVAQRRGDDELATAVERHGAQVVRRPLVADGERGQPVHLVAPQVDADRHVGRGGEDVDDAAAHRELAPVLHLVLAPVAHGHQLGEELGHVDLLPRADDDRRRAFQRAQPLQDGPDRSDDHPGRTAGGSGPASRSARAAPPGVGPSSRSRG